MTTLRTQVAIVGAGPAGLMLGHLLHLAGIDSIIIEARTLDYVIERVRAGVLEQSSVDLIIDAGVGDRLQREALFHDGVYINVLGERRRIDLASLTGGRRIAVYGQNEVVKDLAHARTQSGRPVLFEAVDARAHDLDSRRPRLRFIKTEKPTRSRASSSPGATGLNLALADVWRLSRAMTAYFRAGRSDLLDRYSDECLRRAWRAQWFASWMTSLMHRENATNPFDFRRQVAELHDVTSSRAAMTTFAEHYVGRPLE